MTLPAQPRPGGRGARGGIALAFVEASQAPCGLGLTAVGDAAQPADVSADGLRREQVEIFLLQLVEAIIEGVPRLLVGSLPPHPRTHVRILANVCSVVKPLRQEICNVLKQSPTEVNTPTRRCAPASPRG